MRLNYAVLFVTDMARSIRFYRDVIGVTVRFESPHWTEFDSGDATLALHLANPALPAAEPGAKPPGSCRPGFGVPDLDAFHRRMVELDVPCVQEPKDVFGARIAQYADPDGLTISVSQGPER